MMWMLVCLMCVLLGACGGVREVVVTADPSVRVDSFVLTKVQHDSIYVRDSVVVRDAADTVYVTKWRVEYRQKLMHDTVSVVSIDTIRVPVPVAAKITKWDRMKREAGGLAIGAVVILIVVHGYRFFRRR